MKPDHSQPEKGGGGYGVRKGTTKTRVVPAEEDSGAAVDDKRREPNTRAYPASLFHFK